MKIVTNQIQYVKKKFFQIIGVFFGIFSVLQIFVTWEDVGINSCVTKVLLLLVGLILSGVISILAIFTQKRKLIWEENERSLEICYGDLFNIAEKGIKEEKTIIVIPVNCCFDTSCENNLVAENSVHGQWLKNKMIVNNIELIRKEIVNSLAEQGIKPKKITKDQKAEGNLERYPFGSVASVKGENGVIFYLLAVSRFDNLNAYCSYDEYIQCIQGLLSYYDKYGQGAHLYSPVIGDHMARPVKETKDVIRMMLALFAFYKSKIHGKVSLVVYKKSIAISEFS